jgi:type I restriction enzyme, S subunit
MSFLEKLLNGVGVEWKRLGDVVRIKNGKDHKSLGDGKFPVYGSGGIMRYANTYAYNKPSVLIPRKGSIGNLFFVDVPFWNVDTIFYTEIDEAQIRPKFLYYFLTTAGLGEMNQAGGVPSQTQSVLNELKIPIPCPDNPKKSLEIQAEIVRILDNFTELTARKKQYNYYRDQLLSFEDGEVEWKTLGEVGELIRGNGLPKADFTETGVPAIHYGQIYTYYGTFTTATKSFVSPETATKLRKVDTGDVVITNTSENLEDVGKALVYLGKQQAVTGGHATIFKPSKIIIGKYFAYFTQTTSFANQKRKFAKGTKVIDVSATDMGKINVPIPPLAEQARIVTILDKFDTLTNSISEGLPREIALRQKQYAYYRDLLLSFPKPEEVAA